jgi:carboxylesterase type B
MIRASLVVLALVATTLGEDIVETTFGKVQGSTGTSREGKTFHQFLGIPYAKAGRFEAPTNPETWSDVKDATKFGQVCPQSEVHLEESPEPKKILGSEDCLNLNVFTTKVPKAGEDKVLHPVVIWFHGGGGEIDGAVNYDPTYLMDTNVVLVTFNARTGPFGFFNLGEEQASGNQRLKDELKVLEFVKNNIEKFGGDKDRVTLAGQHSGAAEVHYHIISPKSKGLFHSAISQGGSAISSWYFVRDPIHQAKLYGQQVGCPIESKEALLTCLKGKKTEELVTLYHRWFEIADSEFVRFAPSIEHIPAEKAFLTENPFVSLSEGRINKVPWITGVQLYEGATPVTVKIMRDAEKLQRVNDNFNAIASHMLDYDKTATDAKEVSKKLAEYYFPGKLKADEENKGAIGDLTADRCFFRPALVGAILHSRVAPVYTYVISHSAKVSSQDILKFKPKLPGAHGDDVAYEFPWKAYGYPGIDKSSEDFDFSKNLLALFASFAENGKPTKTWGPNKSWDKFDAAKTPVSLYQLDKETSDFVLPEPMVKRHEFWASLFSKELKSELENPPKEAF